MKKTILTISASALLLFACNNEKKGDEATKDGNAVADTATKTDKKAWIPVDSAAEMNAWMAYATPGEPHKMLAKSAGTWNAETTSWMGMGGPSTTSKGSSVNKMIMDGRYQVSEHKGDMMGMPFNGMAIVGYDNYKKVFVSTWIDNMGTGVLKMEGPWDEASKSMTLTGKYTNPANGLECEMKEIFKIVDDNTQVMELYGPDSKTGTQYKLMEVKYTKKK